MTMSCCTQHGGLFALSSGKLDVSQSTIERATSGEQAQIGLLGQSGSESRFRLLKMTLVEVELAGCGDSLFVQTAPSQVVIQGVEFTQRPDCNVSDPNSLATAPGLEPIRCGGSYIDELAEVGDVREYPICASTSADACFDDVHEGTTIPDVHWCAAGRPPPW